MVTLSLSGLIRGGAIFSWLILILLLSLLSVVCTTMIKSARLFKMERGVSRGPTSGTTTLYHYLITGSSHLITLLCNLMVWICCFGMAGRLLKLRLGTYGILFVIEELWFRGTLLLAQALHLRYTHHQWLVCHGRLGTLAGLFRFGITQSQQCFLCIGAKKLIITCSCIVTIVDGFCFGC